MGRPLLILLVIALVALAAWQLAGEREPLTAVEAEHGATSHVDLATPEPASAQRPAATDARAPIQAEVVEPREPLTVQVVTATSFARDAERVPEVAFELLRSGRTEPAGDYRDPWGKPLELALGPHAELVATGRTDASGAALIELEGDPDELVARVVEPGFQQRLNRVRVSGDEREGACSICLLIWPGATARGRVVDGEGAPVDAKVELLQWHTARGEPRLGHVGGARNTGGGRFELDLAENSFRRGSSFVLNADGGGAGTGTLQEVELSLEAPPQDLNLVVRGAGVVRGRVRDSGGVPAAGLDVLVLLAALDAPDGSFVLPEPAASQLRVEGGGRLWVTTRTDGDGRFEARGLRSELYVVRARAGEPYGGYPILLTPVAVPPDGAPLELAFSRPHLAIRLLDEGGNPRTGDAPVVERDRYQAFGAPHEWPSVPVVRVLQQDVDGDEPIASGLPLDGRVVTPDEVVFELRKPGRYLVGAVGGGYPGSFEAVDVPLGGGRVEVELRAQGALELGTLRVRVTHAGMELTGVGVREPEVDVYLEDMTTAAVLLAREEYGAPSPFVLRAPAGRYRLVAAGKPFVDFHHGTLLTPRLFGRVERDVVLVAGEELEAELELSVGARLEVTLQGESTSEDEAALRAQWPSWEDDWIVQRARRARLYLRAPGRRPVPVQHTEEWTGTSAAGTHLSDEFELGAKVETQLVPAGRFELVARMPGGRTARAPVELRAGSTTAVSLRFD